MSYKTDCMLEHQIRSSVSPVVFRVLAGLPFIESMLESSFLRFRPVKGCIAAEMNILSMSFKAIYLPCTAACFARRFGRGVPEIHVVFESETPKNQKQGYYSPLLLSSSCSRAFFCWATLLAFLVS